MIVSIKVYVTTYKDKIRIMFKHDFVIAIPGGAD